MLNTPVTASITNYNGAKYLPWCIEAVKKLDPSPAEIIVVDNASTDDSVRLIETEYPEVKLIVLDKNEGPCPARNRGLEEAANPLVFQIDCDIAPKPDVLLRLLEAMEKGGETTILCMPRAVFDSDHDLIHYDGGSFHYVGQMNLINFYKRTTQKQEATREVDAVISMALLVRKDLFLEAGGYDSSFFILFEDHDISYRLRSMGYKLLVAPGAVVYHREGTEGVSFREKTSYPKMRAFYHSRNRWIVLLKNHKFITLLLSFPGLLLYELVWFVFSVREGFILDYFRGKLSLISMTPRILAERKKIQVHRIVGDRDLLHAEDFTFSPLIRKSGFENLCLKCINSILRVWWRLIRPFTG